MEETYSKTDLNPYYAPIFGLFGASMSTVLSGNSYLLYILLRSTKINVPVQEHSY